MAGLWLAGEMVNRIGIYVSKVAEGLSSFQRRSCERRCSQEKWRKCISISVVHAVGVAPLGTKASIGTMETMFRPCL